MAFALTEVTHSGGMKLDLHKKTKGFTLIEVLITLIILAISLLALASLMAATTKSNAYGGYITEATTFAQDRLEQLRATRWDSIGLGTFNDLVTGSTGINYARNWNVVQNGNLRTVTVTINWMDRTNHSIRLLSVMSQ
jgi:prepilin-type N-terminal cleavage/methylation domain-containing protein